MLRRDPTLEFLVCDRVILDDPVGLLVVLGVLAAVLGCLRDCLLRKALFRLSFELPEGVWISGSSNTSLKVSEVMD